jgi:hypothetical protein
MTVELIESPKSKDAELWANTMLPPPESLPDYSKIQTEDNKPVDNRFAEKQQRLLVEPIDLNRDLYAGRTVEICANVGLFNVAKMPCVAPDVLFALDTDPAEGTIHEKHNRSYFIWEMGKSPDVVIEIVSETVNEEDTTKLKHYAKIGVPFYVIFDPEFHLSNTELRVFALHAGQYQLLKEPMFPSLGIGLTMWEGTYAGVHGRWLRWCRLDGSLIETGAEMRAVKEAFIALQKEQLTQKDQQLTQKDQQLSEQAEQIIELQKALRLAQEKAK